MVKEEVGSVTEFQRFMIEGSMDPYIQALAKASADVIDGRLSLKDAERVYNVSSDVIVYFIVESEEYDKIYYKKRN